MGAIQEWLIRARGKDIDVISVKLVANLVAQLTEANAAKDKALRIANRAQEGSCVDCVEVAELKQELAVLQRAWELHDCNGAVTTHSFLPLSQYYIDRASTELAQEEEGDAKGT